MMFVLLLFNLVTRFELFKKVLWSIMIMASINCVVAMVEYAGAIKYNYRSTGLMENPNGVGHLAIRSRLLGGDAVCYPTIQNRDHHPKRHRPTPHVPQ